MLNLRESSVKQSNTTTTHGVELSEWNSHLRERPLDHELDSMGLPRLSGKRLVPPQNLAIHHPL